MTLTLVHVFTIMVSLNVSLNFTPFTVKLQTYIHFDTVGFVWITKLYSDNTLFTDLNISKLYVHPLHVSLTKTQDLDTIFLTKEWNISALGSGTLLPMTYERTPSPWGWSHFECRLLQALYSYSMYDVSMNVRVCVCSCFSYAYLSMFLLWNTSPCEN